MGSWLSLTQMRKEKHTPAHCRARWTMAVATPFTPPSPPSTYTPTPSLFLSSSSMFRHHFLTRTELQRVVMGGNGQPWTHIPHERRLSVITKEHNSHFPAQPLKPAVSPHRIMTPTGNIPECPAHLSHGLAKQPKM